MQNQKMILQSLQETAGEREEDIPFLECIDEPEFEPEDTLIELMAGYFRPCGSKE